MFNIVINLAGEKRIKREFLVFVLSYFIIRMIAIGAFPIYIILYFCVPEIFTNITLTEKSLFCLFSEFYLHTIKFTIF